MTDQSFPSMNDRLRLKQATGWFAAGDAFRKAITLLSDGAFRLFVYLCLEADRRTGRLLATHKELAVALGKSKRAIGAYVSELEAEGICLLHSGKNQFAVTIFEISEGYWPYHCTTNTIESPDQEAYVESVRECFLGLGCGNGKFGAAEATTARNLQRQGIPLAVVEDALFLGASRKYMSWFEGKALDPIHSLAYFNDVIAEIQDKPFTPGYSAYLRKKVRELAESWSQAAKTGKTVQRGGCLTMPSDEIVQ
jgi:hypothetical protein